MERYIDIYSDDEFDEHIYQNYNSDLNLGGNNTPYENITIYKTVESAWEAIKKDVNNLHNISLSVINYDMCEYAVKKNPSIIHFMSRQFITPELFMVVLKHIPIHDMTFDFWVFSLSLDPGNFVYMPDEYKTSEICKRVVDSNIEMINYVSINNMDYDMCIKAFTCDYNYAVDYIHEKRTIPSLSLFKANTISSMKIVIDSYIPPIAFIPISNEELHEICSICIDETDTINFYQLVKCSHQFHESCLEAWLNTSQTLSTCPLCRTQIIFQPKVDNLHFLYNLKDTEILYNSIISELIN